MRRVSKEPRPSGDDTLRMLAAVCRAVAGGDLEARVPVVGHDPDAAAAADAVNQLIDVVDAFVRESTASLTAAAEGRYHRRFLPGGMRGAFGLGAATINRATDRMRAAAEDLAAAGLSRLGLADQLESAVLTVSEQDLRATGPGPVRARAGTGRHAVARRLPAGRLPMIGKQGAVKVADRCWCMPGADRRCWRFLRYGSQGW
ncbi:HAMP domain-containing protein [Dactylosporangium sp. CA-152071]|uniref:HAMP domain-containing protein n=1 Tax=Dactylosporangium sp. CA-152071 TaxID=3239933 RepID=UPI003D92D34D